MKESIISIFHDYLIFNIGNYLLVNSKVDEESENAF
jgi:hypothetical protein